MTKSNIRVCEPEIHAYLDSLCTEKFYGKLTFFFQDGNIEACRIESTTAKKTIIAQNGIIPPVKKAYQKPCKQVVVPIQKSPYRRFEQEQPQQSAASGTIQQKGSKKP